LNNEFLSRNGHKVKTVNNGADAIEIIKVEVFDLVLSDLAMPDVYGYDVVNAVNNLEKRPKVGIITGWSGKLEPVDGKEFKVDFYLKKPFKLSELTKQINIAFDAD
jgi:DNA-binding response OmpR family regulator